MSLGLGSKFNVLQRSPLDLLPDNSQNAKEPEAEKWVPSRYNIRATTQDGKLVIWNSYCGTMSVFGNEQKELIEALLSKKGFESQPEGAVKYLIERGFVVREGTNEYRRIQAGFGRQQYRSDTLELILLASEDCNFRCRYCYEDFAAGTMKSWVRDGIKQIVQNRLATLKNLSVSWFGGEPLYGFEAIEDLAPFFKATAEESSLRFSSSMTTNGFLLTPDVAEKVLSWGINSFQITLDGAAEDHDCSRPTREGEGTFATILENLKSLRDRRDDYFRVDLRVNFDKKNYPRLNSFLDTVEDHFHDDPRFSLRFRAVGKWGGPNDTELATCGVEESDRIQSEMRWAARKRGLSLSDDIRSVQGLGAQVCYAARPYNFIVGATGKLMKCTIDLDKQDRNVVGMINPDGTLEVDWDKMALWTEPAFESDGKCRKCVILPTCQGAYCPQIRFDTGNSPCSPLRRSAKREILLAVEALTENARRVRVNSQESVSQVE